MIAATQNRKTQEYLAAADREFAAGNPLAATERLWDAVVCALSAVAKHNGWPHFERDEPYAVAERLNELDDDPDEFLLSGFSAAEYQPDKVRYGFFAPEGECADDARIIVNAMLDLIKELDARYDHVHAKSAR